MSVEAYIDVSLEGSREASREDILEALFKIAERLNTAVQSWPYDSYWVQPSGTAVVAEYVETNAWKPRKKTYRRSQVPYTNYYEWFQIGEPQQ